MKILNIKAIRIDGGTQSRVEINSEMVAEYAGAIDGGAEFPPVVVFHDGADYWLADGFHRYHACRMAGKTSIAADVHTGTARDAVIFSLGANGTHGLNRTNADKRKAVMTMLDDAEWSGWSSNSIAKSCSVSHTFVDSVRASILQPLQDRTTRTVERAGKTYQQDTANIGKAKPVDKVEPAKQVIETTDMATGAELLDQMQETQAENEDLQERIAIMTQDDKAAQIDKLMTRINGLEGRLSQAMNQIKASEDTTKVHAALIHKLRKLLNVEGHKEIYSAVAALVKEKAEA